MVSFKFPVGAGVLTLVIVFVTFTIPFASAVPLTVTLKVSERNGYMKDMTLMTSSRGISHLVSTVTMSSIL